MFLFFGGRGVVVVGGNDTPVESSKGFLTKQAQTVSHHWPRACVHRTDAQSLFVVKEMFKSLVHRLHSI